MPISLFFCKIYVFFRCLFYFIVLMIGGDVIVDEFIFTASIFIYLPSVSGLILNNFSLCSVVYLSLP